MYSTLRSYWLDILLLIRYLKIKGMYLWWDFLLAWEKATPSFYRSLQSAYRQQRPILEYKVSPDIYGSTVVVDGIKMSIDPRMTLFQVQKLVSGRHTREERRLLIHRLEPNDIVMELGGGIGMLAIACSLKIGSNQVHSYEANFSLESLIRTNYALNGVNPHLKMCMLERTAGKRTFYVSEHFSRSSAYKPADRKTTACDVPVEPLNDEIQRIQPTVLILDIEGSEDELLSFADLSTVRKLLVEVHPDMLGIFRAIGLHRRLRDQGFLEIQRSGQSFIYFRQ